MVGLRVTFGFYPILRRAQATSFPPVEYLSARLYNSSIVVGGSKDNEWKNVVDDTKLFLKF